jgi:hypothetical protein
MPVQINGDTGIVFATWSTANRPSNPLTGQTGYNSTSWVNIGPEPFLTGKAIAMSVVFGG